MYKYITTFMYLLIIYMYYHTVYDIPYKHTQKE